MKEKCLKCGLDQDPTKPVCLHMAGRKGGQKVSETHGPDFYSEIGRKGGLNTKNRSPDFMSRIGKLGGAKMKERGTQYYKDIGRKGGNARAASIAPGGYAEMGRKGAVASLAMAARNGLEKEGGPASAAVPPESGPVRVAEPRQGSPECYCHLLDDGLKCPPCVNEAASK